MIEQQRFWFPHPETSDSQGLLAIGGNLEPERILYAYSQGIFPWYQPGCPVLWWSPNPRLLLFPDDFKVSQSFKKTLKKPWRFSIDTEFSKVIQACATISNRENNTWITQEMIAAYTTLHERGYAHSFEVWQNDILVGGLYGLSLGKAFFGESMFHTVSDASKVALYFLCTTMKKWEFDFIDCQMPTAHLLKMGAKIISRTEFLTLLSPTLQNSSKVCLWKQD